MTCVVGDTMILVKNGYYQIRNLENKTVNIWDGFQFLKILILKTDSDQEILSIEFSDGAFINCTSNHKFYIIKDKKIIITYAKKLIIGDKLIDCTFPIINGNEDIIEPYTNGYYLGSDGYKNIISTLHNKKILDQELTYISKQDVNGRREYIIDDVIINVPFRGSLSNKLTWLAGFVDSSGTISNNKIHKNLQIIHLEYMTLLDVKLVCNTLGLNPRIVYYDEYDHYKLLFSTGDTYNLYCVLKMPIKILKCSIASIPIYSSKPILITDINKLKNKYDTYCFNGFSGIMNGVITG